MSRSRSRRIFKTFLILLAAAVVWAAWYGAKRGLTRSWRERVFAEFRAHGIEITFRKLTADPFHGFVAREVVIYDADDHKRALAEVDQVILNVDWSRLIKKRPFVSALELRNARLSLPFDRLNAESKRLEINNLHARMLLPEKQIRLLHAEARTLGLKLRAEGWISNPDSASDGKERSSLDWLSAAQKGIQELESIQWRGEAPLVRIQFSGDLNAPDSLSATLHIDADEFTFRDYAMESLSVSAVWRDGALDVQEILLEDKSGHLNAVGRLILNGSMEGRVESTLDPVKLAAVLGHGLPENALRFEHRPTIRAHFEGHGNPNQHVRVTGSSECGVFFWKGERFESFKAAGSWDGGRWSVRELELTHRSGKLKADALSSPNAFHAKLTSSLPLPLLSLAVPEQPADSPVHWLQSTEPIQIQLEVQGTAPELNACTVWGKVQTKQGTFRGVDFERFATPFSLRGGVWSFGPLQLKRAEGMGEGAITYDGINNGLYLHDLRIRLNPVETMMMIEPEWVGEVSPYRFRGSPPLVTVRGSAAPHSAERTNISVSVESKGGMDYDFAGKTLPLDEVSAQLQFTPHRVQLTSVSGRLFGGKIDGNVDISVRPDGAPHKASLYITDMDFAALSRLYMGYDDSKGRLNCSFLWKGDDDNGRKVDGAGQLSITDGNVFVIPFLGPLSTLLNSVVPGLGVSKAHKATASFTVKDGIFNTRNLHVDGTGFTLRGHGDLRFMDDSMQFYARVNARSLPGLVLFPVSKLFEYASEGKLSKPVWKPRILTRRERAGAEPPLPDQDPEGPSEPPAETKK